MRLRRLGFRTPRSLRSLRSLVELVLPLTTLLPVLGACGTDASTDAADTESAAMTKCNVNPEACNPPPTPCSEICDGSACAIRRSGRSTCRCEGPCSGGLTCSAGQCVPPPPTCSGPPPEYATWWVPGAKYIYFDQLAPGQPPNPNTSCYSGCGPTAWAMFFAQIDSHWRPLAQAGKAPWWTNQQAWFQTTTDASGGISFVGNYPQITIDISHHLGTSCSQPFANAAYTEPTWMASAGDYIKQGPEAQYSPHGPLGGYTAPGMAYEYDTHNTDDSLLPDYLNDYGTLDYARDWIINYGYPVVYGYYVGAAVVANAHYGLATGYREKATSWDCRQINGSMQWVVTHSDNTQWQFFINGGGGDTDDWRSPAAYYVGTIKIFQQ